MPNWCFTDIIIHGPEAEIKNLYNKITEFTSHNAKENDFGLKWLGNVVMNAGFLRSDEDEENGFACRGWLDYCKIESSNKLHIQTETAWGPTNKIWLALIKKYSPNCKFHYCAEEPGCCVYEIFEDETDTEKFYDYDYYLDSYLHDREPNLKKEEIDFLLNFIEERYWKADELLKMINEFQISQNKNTIQESELEQFFEEYNDKLQGENNYIMAYRFEKLTVDELNEKN